MSKQLHVTRLRKLAALWRNSAASEGEKAAARAHILKIASRHGIQSKDIYVKVPDATPTCRLVQFKNSVWRRNLYFACASYFGVYFVYAPNKGGYLTGTGEKIEQVLYLFDALRLQMEASNVREGRRDREAWRVSFVYGVQQKVFACRRSDGSQCTALVFAGDDTANRLVFERETGMTAHRGRSSYHNNLDRQGVKAGKQARFTHGINTGRNRQALT